MSEIKVGDICKVNGFAFSCHDDLCEFLDDEKCEILHIGEHPCITIRLLAPRVKSVLYVHRKQCRKLVKTLPCLECNSLGFMHMGCENSKGKQIVFRVICEHCNGSGKVKLT